ncbi:MAG: insulinase family protein [Clostridia bacterium]|nr:insulinase family protein [Clostridia bacterium]
MRIKEYRDEKLNEVVYCGKHSSGLEIIVMPKAGYDSAYALFAVKYGSIDTSIKREDGTFEDIPEGTAHFLEHKLFECEELDAFELFSRTGAYANAYTSFEQTAYLFKGSNRIDESLGYLLDFVQKPYFTAETVQKEQGIIGQEIRMYQDLPDWMVMFNLLRALYKSNPVRIDIAGTQESIAQIDDKLLYKLYDIFYNPSNMVLSIVGNVDPEQIFAQVDKAIIRKKQPVPERKFIKEPAKPVQDYIECKLSVGRKQFLLGFKEDLKDPVSDIEDEYATEILIEALFGKSSPFFKRMLDEGLVSMDFGGSLFSGYGFSTVMIGGASDNPEAVADAIKKEIKNAKKHGIDPAAFERAKRKYYGRMVMGYNDIDDCSNLLASLYFNGCKPFDDMKSIQKVSLDKANERLAVINEKCSALSVIIPA